MSLMHLTVTECFLAFPVIVFYLNFISFLLIMVPFLRGVSKLPRLAVCLCFAKSLTSYFLTLLSSCSPAITAAPLQNPTYYLIFPVIPWPKVKALLKTTQQHCSSQRGIVLKTKIVNAIAFVCSAREMLQRAVLNGVLGENLYMSWKTFDGLSQALGQRTIYLADSRECWIEMMGKFSNGWLLSHTVVHVLQVKLSRILVKTQDLKQECHNRQFAFKLILDSSFPCIT